MKKYIIPCFAALFALSACNDNYLEKTPVTSQSEASLVTYKNFLTYSWRFYDCFSSPQYVQSWYNNYGSGGEIDGGSADRSYSSISGGVSRGTFSWYGEGDLAAGYLTSAWDDDTDTNYRRRQVSVPSGRNGGGWDFRSIRAVNIMLRNIDGSKMTTEEKAHWRSVCYFFFCYNYAELISRFGDVPWIDHILKDDGSDDGVIYGPRMPRKEVADSVLARLQYAEQNIKVNGEGAGTNTINKACVQALMSRFCLFEGTWRKYHGLGDETKYLQECTRVSEALMTAFPTVDNNYDGLITTQDLKTRPGTILYKEYSIALNLAHVGQRLERSTSTPFAMHRFTTDLYLVKSNGLPVTNAANSARADVDVYDEFRDRDPRLLMTVCPPYSQDFRLLHTAAPAIPTYPFPEMLSTTGTRTYNTSCNYTRQGQNKQEYMELLKTILPDNLSKRLPAFQFQGSAMIWSMPNFPTTSGGATQFRSRAGYVCWRNYNLRDVAVPYAGDNNGGHESDKPIFFIEEILLNEAEAKFELGQFTQDVADKTINKLRRRTSVNMPDMIVANINAATDPSNPNDKVTPGRDTSVDPVLWEIRRERIVELMGLGYGWADVRRWKKGPWYMNRPILGVKIDKQYYKNLDANGNLTATTPPWANNLPIVNKDYTPVTGTSGYIRRFNDPSLTGAGWDDTFYLYPLPTYDLTLNPQLTQNPGWEKY